MLVVVVPPALAQDITSAFISPSQPLVAGSQSSLWLYQMNNSSNEVRQAFETSLNAHFILPSGPVKTVLTLKSGSNGTQVAVAPGAFARQEYVLDVPATIRGQIMLDISNYNEIGIRVEENESAATPPPEAQSSPRPPTPQTNRPTRSALAKFFDNHISPYEPIYFLLGTYPAAEFQFSLKYQIFDLTNAWSPSTNLYFAYTQTSYWDLISSDPSFYDTSYKPSVFVYLPDILGRRDKSIQLDLQGGAEHESNGQGGTAERSLYTAYLQPTVTFGRPGHLQLALQPRAWTYFLVGHNNPDIAEYRGYADLLSALTLKKDPNSWANFQLMTRFRIGDEGTHAGIQIDARYKIPHFNPALQFQYFTGCGQTLRQYNVASHGFRVGLCLWYWPDYPALPTAK